jgi:hypothetical protein
MATYLTVSAIMFFLLAMIWRKSDFLNTMIKAVLFIMAFAGFIFALEFLGYIAKA